MELLFSESMSILKRVLSTAVSPFSSSDVVSEGPPPPVLRTKILSPTTPISLSFLQHEMPPLPPHELRHTARTQNLFSCMQCETQINGIVFFGFDSCFCSESCRNKFLTSMNSFVLVKPPVPPIYSSSRSTGSFEEPEPASGLEVAGRPSSSLSSSTTCSAPPPASTFLATFEVALVVLFEEPLLTILV